MNLPVMFKQERNLPRIAALRKLEEQDIGNVKLASVRAELRVTFFCHHIVRTLLLFVFVHALWD